VEKWANQVAAAHGYVAPDHVMEIFGTCKVCSARAKKRG
jgi:Fur family ferric uptake transcriptional regulator